MDNKKIEGKLYRLSPGQLRALHFLAKSKEGIISSNDSADRVGKKGKALGGIFSSLYRQNFGGEMLVMPWGRSESGRGLRCKLNEKVIAKENLLKITQMLLGEKQQ